MPTLTTTATTAPPGTDDAARLEHTRARPDPTTAPLAGPPAPRDRSPRSLAILLAKTAERVRTDPEANFTDGAVRAAVRILTTRLDERFAPEQTTPSRQRRVVDCVRRIARAVTARDRSATEGP